MRVNFNLLKGKSFRFYTGLEGDYTSFNIDELQGIGEVILPFLGSELFLSRKMSFYMDIGPGMISIRDTKGYDESVSGVELITNIGIWLYF